MFWRSFGQITAACTIDTGELEDVCLGVEQVAELGRLGDPVSVTSGRMNVARLRDRGWAVLDLAAEELLL